MYLCGKYVSRIAHSEFTTRFHKACVTMCTAHARVNRVRSEHKTLKLFYFIVMYVMKYMY